MLKQASLLCEEEHSTGEQGSVFGDGRVREDGGGSDWLRGRGFVWASEGSSIALLSTHILTPPKKSRHAPSSTISHLPPQESKEPEASVPAEQALELPSSTAPSVLEGEIPANVQPLSIQLGGIKRVCRCQVEGCREGPSTSHATICAHMCRVHLGVGLVCPLCNKSFFNPDTFRHHKKSHVNL